MTLAEIQTVALKHLGYYTEDIKVPSAVKEYDPELTALINEAYFIVCARRYHPIYTEIIDLDENGCFLLKDLTYEVQFLRTARPARTPDAWQPVLFACPCNRFIDAQGEKVCFGVKPPPEQAEVEYEFVPKRLSDPLDAPIYRPEHLHHILADYAASRIMSSGRGEKQQRAGALLSFFERSLLDIKAMNDMSIPRRQHIYNKY